MRSQSNMGSRVDHQLLAFLLVSLALTSLAKALPTNYRINSLHRHSFPRGFVFGAASSAYQNEGAAFEGGKGPSIWDTFTQRHPEKIKDHSNANVATDSYHRYKEDVKLLKHMGVDAYRFSISWSRVLPRGSLSGGVNEEGLAYYSNLINELRDQGIEPYVTLFHWDLPQALEDKYNGFRSRLIVDDFRDYAELCFKRFGDRVKNWITLNEPLTYSTGGYEIGLLAPGRCSWWKQNNCIGGDSGIEPYQVTHYLLLAHAAAVRVYRQRYQALQKGQIGITLVTRWMEPFSNESIQRAAAKRALDFHFGWFMHPLTFGDYPQSMRYLVRSRLPIFTPDESNSLKGSFDFLGLNYYTAGYVMHAPHWNVINLSFSTDSRTNSTVWRDGKAIGPKGASNWLYIYPMGIRDLLVYIKNTYNNPDIYITENGIDEASNSTLSLDESLADDHRIDYYYQHLSFVHKAIREGVNVKGYIAWALMDNFEWNEGYTVRFGLNFVDYNNGLNRRPKRSAVWFRNFLRN